MARSVDSFGSLRAETRIVSNDWVVRYHNRLLQLKRQSGHAPARSTALVCENAAGVAEIRYRDRAMRWTEIVAGDTAPPRSVPAPPTRPAPVASRARERIDEWFERHARHVRGGGPTGLAG